MEPIYLMKFVGAFLTIYGVIAITRKQVLIAAVHDMTSSRGMLMLLATVELLAGLALVFAYPSIGLTWIGLIAVVGYLMVIEAVLYLAFPKKLMQPVVLMVNKPISYLLGGAFSVVLGMGMLGTAFGWW